MAQEWQKPGTAEAPRRETYFSPKEVVGRLVGIEVLDFEKQRPKPNSQYGDKDTVWANLTIFDGDRAGEVVESVALDTTVLVRQLRDKVGQSVLGRVDRDFDNKGAYTLLDPTEADFDIASGAQTKPEPKKAPWEK